MQRGNEPFGKVRSSNTAIKSISLHSVPAGLLPAGRPAGLCLTDLPAAAEAAIQGDTEYQYVYADTICI